VSRNLGSQPKLWAACAALGLTLLAQPLHATSIVNWDGGVGGQTYLSGAPTSQTLSGTTGAANISYGGGVATDRQGIRPFSTTTVLSPTTNYPNGVNTSLYSTTFYGAYESIVMDAPSGSAINSEVIRAGTSSSTPDGSVMKTTYARPTGSDYVGTNVVIFQKADFLNGGSSGSLTLSSMSMTMTTPSVTAGTASNMRGRWVIANGSSYYVSQTTFSMDAGTVSLADFTLSQWSVYTPSTAAGTVLNFQPTSFSTVNFNNVQAVGFYAETWDGVDQIIAGSGSGGGNVGAAFNVTDFGVTAVPEPSAIALLGGGLVILAGFRIARMKRQAAL